MQLAGSLEDVTGGTDGLVGFLGVLDLAGVLPRGGMQVFLAVELTSLVAGGVNGRLRQRGRVGTHVGDVAVLVEPLRDAHRAFGGEPQLATRLLLQRRGHERCIGAAGVGLLLHRRHRQLRPAQTGGQALGAGLVEHEHLIGLADRAQRVEVAAGGHPATVDGVEFRGERRRLGLRIGDAGVQLGADVPVPGAAERHALPLALDDDAGRHRLHPAGRQLRGHLLPQHRADLIAVEPVQDAAGLLCVDQIGVQVARVLGGRPDGRLGDLVEHHPLDRDARFQGLEQVPGDGLAFAVTVRGQIELVDVLELVLEVGDGALLVRADDVERLEVVVDVHTQSRPRLGLVLGRHVGGRSG